jgi:hypothetical protein
LDSSFAKCWIRKSPLTFPDIAITDEQTISCETASWEKSSSCLNEGAALSEKYFPGFNPLKNDSYGLQNIHAETH